MHPASNRRTKSISRSSFRTHVSTTSRMSWKSVASSRCLVHPPSLKYLREGRCRSTRFAVVVSREATGKHTLRRGEFKRRQAARSKTQLFAFFDPRTKAVDGL